MVERGFTQLFWHLMRIKDLKLVDKVFYSHLVNLARFRPRVLTDTDSTKAIAITIDRT